MFSILPPQPTTTTYALLLALCLQLGFPSVPPSPPFPSIFAQHIPQKKIWASVLCIIYHSDYSLLITIILLVPSNQKAASYMHTSHHLLALKVSKFFSEYCWYFFLAVNFSPLHRLSTQLSLTTNESKPSVVDTCWAESGTSILVVDRVCSRTPPDITRTVCPKTS